MLGGARRTTHCWLITQCGMWTAPHPQPTRTHMYTHTPLYEWCIYLNRTLIYLHVGMRLWPGSVHSSMLLSMFVRSMLSYVKRNGSEYQVCGNTHTLTLSLSLSLSLSLLSLSVSPFPCSSYPAFLSPPPCLPPSSIDVGLWSALNNVCYHTRTALWQVQGPRPGHVCHSLWSIHPHASSRYAACCVDTCVLVINQS